MRLAAPFALTMTLALAAPAMAQVSPTDIRSGCLSFSDVIGIISSSMYVVPSGYRFVLTDLTFTRANGTSAPPSASTEIVRLTVNVGGGTPVVRWVAGDKLTASDPPLQLHWNSGLVFEPNQSVEAAVTVLNGPLPFGTVCWSGYVVPTTTSSVVPGPPASSDLALQAAPNPTQESTELRFSLARKQRVTVGVFAVDGRRVRTLYSGPLEAGEHLLAWDGRDDAGRPVANGLYFAELETAEGRATRRVARVR